MEQEFDDEVRSHLGLLEDENLRRGMPPQEARYAALRSFGGVDQTKERYREQRGLPFVDAFFQDVRYGWRGLLRNPGFAAVAIMTLALGIGANTAMFTVIDSVLLRPLPFRNPDRLVSIKMMWGAYEGSVSWSSYQDIRSRSHLLEDIMGISYGDLTVVGTPQGGQKVCRATITANVLDMLGVHPALGRPFDSKDYESDAAPVVLLGAELWRDRFGSDPLILGRQVRLGGVPHTVVGIMPDSFHFKQPDADISSRVWVPSGNHGGLSLTGKLKPGVTPQAVQAEFAAIAQNSCNKIRSAAVTSSTSLGHTATP